MTYDDIRAAIDRAAATDPQLRSVMKRIREGKATFRDTAAYSQRLSALLGEVFSTQAENLSPEEREAICKALLRGNYDEIGRVFAQVQERIDEENGLHLTAVRPAYPTERVDQLAHSLLDPGVQPETIRRRAQNGAANVSQSFHDDLIAENAKIRSALGLKCYLVRETDGSCCKWCDSLAGRYVYGSHPGDIFRRHDNCGCTVTYENGRERQDVWSKRTWDAQDPKEVMRQAREPVKLTQEQAERLQENALQQLTLAGERDIIDLGSDAMFRRKKEGKIEPMPKKQFQRIVKRFKEQGGIFQFNEETDSYLESRNAEAITYDAKTILIRQNPGRASVYEELIHTAQYRLGRNDGSYPSRLRCEIEAQEKMLRNAKAYKLTEPEIMQTQKALVAYQNELEAYYKNGGE
ncbi:MAG: hypothetical protein IJ825_03180 [Oscillospiraceae bacterium]|nr:hypothetical protein [Oscillospiraceae bacterium]